MAFMYSFPLWFVIHIKFKSEYLQKVYKQIYGSIFVLESILKISLVLFILNYINMKKLSLILLLITFSVLSAMAQNQPTTIVQSNGLFFTDSSQDKLYSGEFKEYFENGALKVEINIKDGRPEGAYIIYFDNGKPNEVRAYRNGEFHGVWRTYNEAGMLIAEAEYRNNKKHGEWHVWDDSGIIRYEMHYTGGKKSGTWYMWDEKGKLISEKKY